MERDYFQCPNGRRRRTLQIESAKPSNTHVDNLITPYRNGCNDVMVKRL